MEPSDAEVIAIFQHSRQRYILTGVVPMTVALIVAIGFALAGLMWFAMGAMILGGLPLTIQGWRHMRCPKCNAHVWDADGPNLSAKRCPSCNAKLSEKS